MGIFKLYFFHQIKTPTQKRTEITAQNGRTSETFSPKTSQTSAQITGGLGPLSIAAAASDREQYGNQILI